MEIDYAELPSGSHENVETTKIIDYDFSPFTIKVKLGMHNQFLEITEVGLNKSFITDRTNQIMKSTHDIEEFYK